MSSIEVNGTPLEVVERGEGEPVVLVHGSESDLRTWDLQIEALSDSFRTIIHSRRYHGPNPPIGEGDRCSPSQHMGDLGELIGAGADVDVGRSGSTPLFYAAFGADVPVVQAILQRGIDGLSTRFSTARTSTRRSAGSRDRCLRLGRFGAEARRPFSSASQRSRARYAKVQSAPCLM